MTKNERGEKNHLTINLVTNDSNNLFKTVIFTLFCCHKQSTVWERVDKAEMSQLNLR